MELKEGNESITISMTRFIYLLYLKATMASLTIYNLCQVIVVSNGDENKMSWDNENLKNSVHKINLNISIVRETTKISSELLSMILRE